MSRLALVFASLRPGGVERAMLNLARGLATLGLPVELVIFDARGAFVEFIPPDVDLVDLKSTRVLYGLPALVSYLRRARPTAMISAMDHVNAACILAKRLSGLNCRSYPTVHKIFGRPSTGGSFFTGRLERILARELYPRADKVVAVSQAVERSLRSVLGLPEGDIVVIPNPVVDDRIERLAKAKADHEWLNLQNEEVILGMGRLVSHKDFATLIQAFGLLLEKRQARLLILGEGPSRSGLEALVRGRDLADRVSLPGFVPNPYAYLARARLFAQSSISESFGISLVEAMALGLPVVSTMSGGPEEILAGGRFGKLVGVQDIEGFATAMLTTLQEPPSMADLRNRAQRYSVERVAREYMDLLDE